MQERHAIVKSMAAKSCSICGEEVIARGWCWRHYQRWRRYGSPELPTRPSPATVPVMQRILERTTIDPVSGCWVWTGGQSGGYGMIHDGTRLRSIHRISFEFYNGPLLDDFTIDHLCYRRRCFNPDHLEQITLAENIRRAWRRRKRLGPLAGSD